MSEPNNNHVSVSSLSASASKVVSSSSFIFNIYDLTIFDVSVNLVEQLKLNINIRCQSRSLDSVISLFLFRYVRDYRPMRLPSQQVVHTTPSPRNQPRLLIKMDSSSQESNGSSNFGTPTGLGMTSAISIASPKPIDMKLTKELEEALKPYGCFESIEEMTHRMEVLSKLDGLVKKWVCELSILKNMPPNIAEQVI